MSVALNAAAVDNLMGSSGVVAMLTREAKRLAAEVRRVAPRHSGRYAQSISVGQPTKTKDGPVVPVESSDPFAHLVEFGSINNEPFAPMRRAPRNLGFPTKDIGR